MRLLTINLSAQDRARLKKTSQSVVTRLVTQSPELQSVLNRGENRALRVLGSLPALFAGSAVGIALFFLRDFLGQMTILAPLAEMSGRLIAAGAVGLALLIFNPFANWLDNHLLQAWSSFYITRRKYFQGKDAAAILDAVENLIRTRPEQIAAALDDLALPKGQVAGLPKSVAQAIENFPSVDGPPAIVMRKFMERKLKSAYVQERLESPRIDERDYHKRYFLRARAVRNAVRTQLLFDQLGAELRAEVPGNTDWQRQYYSDIAAQETTLFDSRDLPRRFRTAAPHYRWPVATARDSVGETALYRIIAAIENPMLQPFYLITVKQVIGLFPEIIRRFMQSEEDGIEDGDPRIEERVAYYLDILTTADVTMFGKWDQRTLRPSAEVNIVPQSILRNLAAESEEPDWILRWDPNRIAWAQFDESDGETRKAFAVLVAAVDSAAKTATRIELTRGDALLVDNLRCLIARNEIDPKRIANGKRWALYPQSWWLRGYYGFRVPGAERAASPTSFTPTSGFSGTEQSGPDASGADENAPGVIHGGTQNGTQGRGQNDTPRGELSPLEKEFADIEDVCVKKDSQISANPPSDTGRETNCSQLVSRSMLRRL